jgi:predicted glycosyltransferase
MKIVVDINHPADVHYFKNFIWEMKKRGHEVLITASEKEISFTLLSNYGFNFINLGTYGNSISKKFINIPFMDWKMYKAVKSFEPDIFVGFGSIRAAHVSRLMRKPCIAFEDSEPTPAEHILYVSFTDAILTPSCFKKDFGRKQIRFEGYKELSYLHPNYFKSNPAVLDEIGLSKYDKFILLRFVAWTAVHDVRRQGIKNKKELVKKLEKYAPVFISSEASLPKELEKYRLPISPEKIHNFLYYAKLLVCDSQTMTTEAGILGTPAIRCNSFVGENDMSNFIELEQKYGLIFNYNNLNKAINKAFELIQKPNLKEEWQQKRETLLKDKIDVTAFMVWFIENYPESFKEMKDNPKIQYRFRGKEWKLY